jgi:hypothetical protein
MLKFLAVLKRECFCPDLVRRLEKPIYTFCSEDNELDAMVRVYRHEAALARLSSSLPPFGFPLKAIFISISAFVMDESKVASK